MESKEDTSYTLPAQLLQAVVSILNELPAGRVRGLLNALEQACVAQDEARREEKTK